MRLFNVIVYLAILTASVLALTINTRSPKHSWLSDFGKDIGPDHEGFKCGDRKFDYFYVFKVFPRNCRKPRKSPYFWFSQQDRHFPKLFSEAERLGFSKGSKILPIREGFFKPFKYDYVVFEPWSCTVTGLVHHNKTRGDGAFQLCERTTWPTGVWDFFTPPP